jgi:hypothetical protein
MRSTYPIKANPSGQDGKKWLFLVLGAPFFFLGIGMMIFGMCQVASRWSFANRCKTRTIGRVVDFEVHASSSTVYRSSTKIPVVTFTTADGVEMRFTSKLAGNEPVGTEVSVVYNPANPREAERAKVMDSVSTPPTVLTVFGLIFTCVTLLWLKSNVT